MAETGQVLGFPVSRSLFKGMALYFSCSIYMHIHPKTSPGFNITKFPSSFFLPLSLLPSLPFFLNKRHITLTPLKRASHNTVKRTRPVNTILCTNGLHKWLTEWSVSCPSPTQTLSFWGPSGWSHSSLFSFGTALRRV